MTTDHPADTAPDTGPDTTLPLLEALHSTPSWRYLGSRPIPDEVVWAILDAAVRGPSGGNRQGWGWVVVTDDAVKHQVAAWYRAEWQHDVRRPPRRGVGRAARRPTGSTPARSRAADHLAAHIQDAPVWVFAVLRNAADSTNPRLGASIYGAIQQLILAARAYGIGTTLTTFHTSHEAELAPLLGLPADALTMALLPLGYPERGRWTEPRRRPVEEVVHWDRWGAHRSRLGG